MMNSQIATMEKKSLVCTMCQPSQFPGCVIKTHYKARVKNKNETDSRSRNENKGKGIMKIRQARRKEA